MKIIHFVLFCLIAAPLLGADNHRGTPLSPGANLPPAVPLKVDYITVTGTVTVRLDGFPANAQQVTYNFAPEFRFGAGSLEKTGEGTYYLKTDSVPKTESYTLTIFATYNDEIKAADGVIEKRGQIFSGSFRTYVPYGDDYDFGSRLIDLKPY